MFAEKIHEKKNTLYNENENETLSFCGVGLELVKLLEFTKISH
jgi:hypothetical protein